MLIQSDEMDLFSVSTILRDGESLGTMFSNFIELGVVIFVLMLAKYVALAILTNLYRLDNITNVHYFKVIQASSIFFLVVVVFLSVSAVSAPEVIKNIQNILLIPISIFFLLRLILIYFTINKMTPLKNLYLFSYLCIVEVIPLIVGIRYAL